MTATAEASKLWTPRWQPVPWIPEQRRLIRSGARFRVCYAGRRSGKTEILKRASVREAMVKPMTTVVLGGPTHQQAKRLYWDDVQALTPQWAEAAVSQSELTIHYVNGSKLLVGGMDKPQRFEGFPVDFLGLDEYADMKADVWQAHMRPSLSTPGRRPGRAVFIGTPDGRNHFYDLTRRARVDADWDVFHWKSAEVLDRHAPGEIEAARRDMDELIYRQEYEADFIAFTGRVYYGFDEVDHGTTELEYDPKRPLVFCFDFNVDPGVAAVLQEQPYGFLEQPGRSNPHVEERIVAVLGEVWIPGGSTTPMVCRKLLAEWGHHQGEVRCYGDASGGARGTAKLDGSDWDLIRKELRHQWPKIQIRVPKANPAERVRVNSLNALLRNADGEIRLLIDPRCKHLIDDLERVTVKEGTDGEIDKSADSRLTHLSDALGYFAVYEYPASGRQTRVEQVA